MAEANDWLRVVVAFAIATASFGCRGPRDDAAHGANAGIKRLATNQSCEACHVDEAREWSRSRHRDSASNQAFSAAFRLEPDPFCWRCHAPEARDEPGIVSSASAAGVACVTCHLDAHGEILGARVGRANGASHAVVQSDRLSGSKACAGCHEFAFPSVARQKRELMQTTLSEHARSAFAAQSCGDCHMPKIGADQHFSHAFAATRDPMALRNAVRVSTERQRGELHVRITPEGVGHAFPTGDLFRRLRVVVEAVEGERVVRREQRYLARHFEHRIEADGVSRREEVADDRPGARTNAAPAMDATDTVDVDVDFQAEGVGRRLKWRVSYERVDQSVREIRRTVPRCARRSRAGRGRGGSMNERALLSRLCCLGLLLPCCHDTAPTHADNDPPPKLTSALVSAATAPLPPPSSSAPAQPPAERCSGAAGHRTRRAACLRHHLHRRQRRLLSGAAPARATRRFSGHARRPHVPLRRRQAGRAALRLRGAASDARIRELGVGATPTRSAAPRWWARR